MIKNQDLVSNSFGDRLVVVQAGSVVSAVRPLGRSEKSMTWYPTASLTLVLAK